MQFNPIIPPLKSICQFWQKLCNELMNWSFWSLTVSYENQIKSSRCLYTVLSSLLRDILLLKLGVESRTPSLGNLLWQVTHCSPIMQCVASACGMSIGESCRVCCGLQALQQTLLGNCPKAVAAGK